MKKYRLGVTGIGRGFALMMPTLKLHPQIEVVAGVDPNPLARESFQFAFDRPTFASLEEMLKIVALDAVYIASPHQFHLDDILTCVRFGKVVLCEKPMAIDLISAQKIVEASVATNIPILIGPSHSYDEPILCVAKMMAQEKYGAVKMLQMINYTDFLFRPRRPEELDITQGGGVLFSQASHQVDIARLLCGGRVTQINARTGNFDASRSTVGAYQAQMDFQNGAFASLTYSGYAHYDSDELCSNISELGFQKSPSFFFNSRAQLDGMKRQGLDEAESKATANQKKIRAKIALPDTHEHFGAIIISCEKADIRLFPDKLRIYADEECLEIRLEAPTVPRKNVIDELLLAIERKPVLHDAKWGFATIECLHAIQQSSDLRQPQNLHHQMSVPKNYFHDKG